MRSNRVCHRSESDLYRCWPSSCSGVSAFLKGGLSPQQMAAQRQAKGLNSSARRKIAAGQPLDDDASDYEEEDEEVPPPAPAKVTKWKAIADHSGEVTFKAGAVLMVIGDPDGTGMVKAVLASISSSLSLTPLADAPVDIFNLLLHISNSLLHLTLLLSSFSVHTLGNLTNACLFIQVCRKYWNVPCQQARGAGA